MLDRSVVQEIVKGYERGNLKIGFIASHSALDVADGAVEEGFRSVAFCQKGRERTYTTYFKAYRNDNGEVVRGIVDDAIVLDKFKEVMEERWQRWMRENSVIFIPNRSFTSYVDLKEIEENFRVPMFGSRNMLRMEEREEKKSYYWLLEKAGLPFPEKIEDPRDINELVIVKLHHAVKKLERGFFTAASYKEYREKSEELIRQGVITEEDLEKARIERYIIGP
ncbi:MAG: DUF1246 domain-containing protein, partial [Thermoplasmata archaeon]|nr:DUF1246 domain-containing protein [Thermoplasmata archaeon]